MDSVSWILLESAPMLGIIRDLLSTPEPANLGPGPRPGVRPESEIHRLLQANLQFSEQNTQQQKLIRSLVLLWHDHLDDSHSISQEINNTDGAFVHGIMHRREPDYANAAYWFRRVGTHGAYSALAEKTLAFLEMQKASALAQRLISRDKWQPFEFIDACAEAIQNQNSAAGTLREIQRIETEVLLEYFLNQESTKAMA